MLLDLLSSSNIVSFNIKVADLVGLEGAVYLSELMAINEKAIRKGKTVDGDFFIIDRDYLKQRTTLTPTKQKSIEDRLCNLEVLKKKPDCKDEIALDVDLLASMLDSDLQTPAYVTEKLKRIAKKPEDKREGQKINARKGVSTEIPALRELFYSWIDNVFSKGNFITREAVQLCERKLYEKSDDLQEQIAIMEYVVASSYTSHTYAFEAYDKEHPESHNKAKPTRTLKSYGEQVVF